MKKTAAKKKERWEVICDLVDCHLDEEITQDELVNKLMKLVGKPIITISEIEFRVTEWKEILYLESREELTNGCRDNWCKVEDLTHLRVYEYNLLVDELYIHYPDYPIEHLESRFV